MGPNYRTSTLSFLTIQSTSNYKRYSPIYKQLFVPQMEQIYSFILRHTSSDVEFCCTRTLLINVATFTQSDKYTMLLYLELKQLIMIYNIISYNSGFKVKWNNLKTCFQFFFIPFLKYTTTCNVTLPHNDTTPTMLDSCHNVLSFEHFIFDRKNSKAPGGLNTVK